MSYYEEARKNRDEQRAKAMEKEPVPVGTHGMAMPSAMYDPELKEIEPKTAVDICVRISMATIANAVHLVGWEKYLDGMERVQWPSVEKRAIGLMKEFGCEDMYHKGTGWDVKLHTLTWSRGCGWAKNSGTLYEFDEFGHKAGSWDCPQINCLREMGLIDEIDNLSIWCDAYDGLIYNAVQPNETYNHLYCLHHDDHCQQCGTIIDEPFLKGPLNGTDYRKPGEETLYEAILRCKREKRETIPVKIRDINEPSWKLPTWYQDWPEVDIAKRGVRTKFHIFTDALILGGHLCGWEALLNRIAETQTENLQLKAKERTKLYKVNGTGLKDVGAFVASSYAAFPYEFGITRYTDKVISAVATKCPIYDAAVEMGFAHVEDLSLWCDWFKNLDVKAVNPEYHLTHTHCLARGDNYCRWTIE